MLKRIKAKFLVDSWQCVRWDTLAGEIVCRSCDGVVALVDGDGWVGEQGTIIPRVYIYGKMMVTRCECGAEFDRCRAPDWVGKPPRVVTALA